MKTIPVAVVHRMTYNKTPLQSRRLKYKDKSYRFAAFDITKADFAKLKTIDGKAAIRLDVVKIDGVEHEINAASIDIKELKTIILENPIVGVLGIAKGVTSDTGSPKYVTLTAIAFDSLDSFDKAKIQALKNAVERKEVRDSQRTKLYRWEGVYFRNVARKDTGWKKTKTAKLKEIAKRVLEHFKIPLDKVHIDTKATASATRLGVTRTFRDDVTSEAPNYNIVHIHDATPDTLIHELAHVVAWHKYKKGEASGHGPEFCGIYAHILGLFTQFDEEDVIDSMKKAGIKVKRYVFDTKDVEEL